MPPAKTFVLVAKNNFRATKQNEGNGGMLLLYSTETLRDLIINTLQLRVGLLGCWLYTDSPSLRVGRMLQLDGATKDSNGSLQEYLRRDSTTDTFLVLNARLSRVGYDLLRILTHSFAHFPFLDQQAVDRPQNLPEVGSDAMILELYYT